MVRGEPQAVVDQVGVLLRDALLHPVLLLRERYRLQRPVRLQQRDGGRRLVDLARLDAHQPVLDHVDAADAVLARQRREPLHQRHRARPLAVQRHRHPVVERHLDVRRLVGGAVQRARPLVRILGRLHPRVFEGAAFHRAAPQVLVGGVGRADGGRDRDAVPVRVVDGLLAGQHMLARGAHDGQLRRERVDGDIEPHLVVALAGAAVRDGGCTHFMRSVHEQLRDQRPPERGGEGVGALVDGVRGEAGEGEEAQEVLARVDHIHRRRPRPQPALARRLDVRQLAQVDHQADDVVAALLLQPLRRHRGIEAAGVGEDDGFGHGGAPGSRCAGGVKDSGAAVTWKSRAGDGRADAGLLRGGHLGERLLDDVHRAVDLLGGHGQRRHEADDVGAHGVRQQPEA